MDAVVPIVVDSDLTPKSGNKVGIGHTVTLLLAVNDTTSLAEGYPKVSLGEISMMCLTATNPWAFSARTPRMVVRLTMRLKAKPSL